jgi:SOS-response transcriptional repressor LexA
MNSRLSFFRTLSYTVDKRIPIRASMRIRVNKPKSSNLPKWATMIASLRLRLKLTQTDFGRTLQTSAMAVSRWERGEQAPPAQIFIELGNMAGDPDCWFFWARTGLTTEDLIRVIPKLQTRIRDPRLQHFQIVHAGSSRKKSMNSQIVAIPLLKIVAGTPNEKGDAVPVLHDAPVEGMIAIPKDWCPNPYTTVCLSVRGDSMNPLIYDGNLLAVDSSQTDRASLNGKIVIAWNEDAGLTVSRLRRYDHTEVLDPENREYEAVSMDRKAKWKILGKVLWWVGKAP